MPYIKLTDRPMFDTMIDGLVPKIRGFDCMRMAQVAGSLVINALTPTSYAFGPDPAVTGIVYDLGRRIRVRGDANYCVCRILLEGMKPETGWSYHSLSDVIMAGDAAINLVYDIQREKDLRDADVIDAVSVLGDAVIEIERRLLGPYEDTAILKNGDLACFASEDFVLKPFGLGLGLSGVHSGRTAACGCMPCRCEPRHREPGWELSIGAIPPVPDMRAGCGCVCDPCRCEPESEPILVPDLSVIKGDGPMPLVAEALTQAQCDAIDRERQSHE